MSVPDSRFRPAFDEHTKYIWHLGAKLVELEEFRRQWETLFDLLTKKKGRSDCTIKILNNIVFRTYSEDKPHVLASDFYTLVSGQLIDQYTVFKEARKNLKILSEKEYYDPERKIRILTLPHQELDEEQIEARMEQIRRSNARMFREQKIESMKILFPNVDSTFQISEADGTDLLHKLKQLAERLKIVRNVVNHKYEKIISDKYRKQLDFPDLSELRRIFDEYCQLVSAIGLIHHDASYTFELYQSYERTISDAIDLILFGSINQSLNRLGFYEKTELNEPVWYWKKREDFFNSDKILEVLNNTVKSV